MAEAKGSGPEVLQQHLSPMASARRPSSLGIVAQVARIGLESGHAPRPAR